MPKFIVQQYNQDREDGAPVWSEYTYDTPTAADAIAAFYAEHVRAGIARQISCHGVPTGPRPERMLMNWERDPFAEVSDGALSNLAAQWSNHKAELAWRPEYCVHITYAFHCPACGEQCYERRGQYGAFFACDMCGMRTSVTTKKGRAIEDSASPVAFCGTRMVSRVSRNFCSYAGCPTCEPEGDYEKKPIGALIGYRDR